MRPTAARYFAASLDAFAQASRMRPGPSLALALAGRRVTLRFAGERLAALLGPALALAPAQDEPPGLEVALWDFDEVAVAPPPPLAWPRLAAGHAPDVPIEVPGFDDPDIKVLLSPDFRLLWMLDRRAQRALVWARGFAALPAWELLHPLRDLLHLWLRDAGHCLLHAGCVGSASGGVLVAGRGGAGKSTTVLAALAGGLATAGDDYVVLTETPEPRAHALYATMRLFGEHAARFPGLLPAADHRDLVGGRPKLAAYMGRHRPQAFLPSLPLRAIVAPQVRPGGRCALEPLPPQEVLAALAPSTLQQLRPDPPVLAAMQRLCRTLPGHRLLLGQDLEALPGLLAHLLRQPNTATVDG